MASPLYRDLLFSEGQAVINSDVIDYAFKFIQGYILLHIVPTKNLH